MKKLIIMLIILNLNLFTLLSRQRKLQFEKSSLPLRLEKSPLITAITSKSMAINDEAKDNIDKKIDKLIEEGHASDIDKQGNTPLIAAVRHGDIKTFEKLWKEDREKINVNHRGNGGNALTEAAHALSQNWSDISHHLDPDDKNKIDPDDKNKKSLEKIYSDYKEMIRDLILITSDVNIPARDVDGVLYTPLDYIEQTKDDELIYLLKARGAVKRPLWRKVKEYYNRLIRRKIIA